LNLFQVSALLISLVALLAYLNSRLLHWPVSIAVTVSGLVLGSALPLLGGVGAEAAGAARALLGHIPFSKLVLQGLLGFLLFAGSLGVGMDALREQARLVFSLATLSTLVTALLLGLSATALLRAAGLAISPAEGLLFGALLSPTDPVAVLDLIRRRNFSAGFRALIAGEALFNDGVGLILFTSLLGAVGHQDVGLGGVLGLLARQVILAILLGGLLGILATYLLSTTDDPLSELLITLAVASGGYSLALALGSSGPLTMVVSGLLIGHYGWRYGLSERSRERVGLFWESLDELLNTVLFALIGLEVITLGLRPRQLLLAPALVALMLLIRLFSVQLPLLGLRRVAPQPRGTGLLLTWGGLRGGLTLALALSLPQLPERQTLVSLAYWATVFSIVVQGLSMPWMLERVSRLRGRRASRPL
jgi:CPA1 family monovalent cation:H+ antiporter